MEFTYDLNTNGKLIIKADSADRERLKVLANDQGQFNLDAEFEALELPLRTSTLSWIDPIETGDLTDAPMLGIRDDHGNVKARWAFMDYQVRSFVEDLIEKGQAIFVS